MRVAVPRLRSLLCLVVVATSWAAPPRAHGQPVTTVARAGWRVGGNVTATARLGNVLYIGGNFRGVAPEGNVAAGVLAVDATSGLPGPAAKLNGNVLAIESDGAGGWYVGGNFVEAVIGGTPQSRVRLVHLLPNGDLDPAFAATVDGGPVRALEFVPGVGLFVGGDFTGLNGAARASVGLLNATTGAVDSWTYTIAANAPNNPSVRALAHDAGALVIGGSFNTVNGLTSPNLAVVSATDINQIGPATGVNGGLVEALMVAPSGTIYIGGGFSNLLSQPRSRLARASHTAGTLTLSLDPWNPGADGNVRAFAAGAGTIFVGGDFFAVGGAGRQRVAELDVATGAPTAFAPAFSGSINALALSNGRLFAAGSFDRVVNEGRYGAAAVTVATGAVLPWNPAPAGTPFALAATGNTVIMGGTIVGFGAVGRTGLAAVDLQSGAILPWNPNPDNNTIDEILIHGNSVYVSGNFFTLSGDQRRGVAQLDPIFGEPLDFDAQLNGQVTAMIIDGNSLYLGGSFTVPRTRLARFDLTTGALDPAFVPTITGTVNDLAVSGGTLFLAGNQITVNGGGLSPLAAVDTATGALVPGFTAGANAGINELDVEGSFLYLAGTFSMVNFTARDAVARVSTATGALDAWAPDLEVPTGAAFGFTRSVNDVDAVNGVVILSGAFETVGGQTRLGVATVDATTGAPTAWAPQLGTPVAGFGSAILTAPDVTVIGGSRIQLADELFNGLALFVEPSAPYVLPPTNLSATIIGSTITFTWALPPLGLPGVSFILEAGTASGLTNIATVPIGSATLYTVNGVPPGTYYVRVRSVHASGTSAPTPDIAVTVGGTGCTSPPQPPLDFDYQIDSGVLRLSWIAGAGPAPTGYILQAGTAPGLANITTQQLGPVPEIVVPGVPPGVYWVRVLAKNGCGISAPSSNYPLLVDVETAAPLEPLGFTGTASGGVVQLSWVEPPYLTPTSYLLEAGTAPGLSNIAVGVPVASTSFSVPGVPPGVYYLRVRGVNASGVGAPSAELRLVVP